jgi:eukaryotic-like serine/threonine-protein kinase
MHISDTGNVFVPGYVLGDRYLLEQRLAGPKDVSAWRGRDLELQRPVEVRIAAPTADPQVVARVKQHLVALCRVEHECLSRIFDARTIDGYLAVISEPIDAIPLAALLPSAPAGWHSAIAIIEQVAAALCAMHRAGVVHRRVGYDAVALTRRGSVKLLATEHVRRALASSQLTTEETLSKEALSYVAPELAAGTQVTVAADVYAAGVLTWELVTGQRAWKVLLGPESEAGLARCERLVPGLPQEVGEIVDRATDPDPERRYADGCELDRALTQLAPARPEALLLQLVDHAADDQRS